MTDLDAVKHVQQYFNREHDIKQQKPQDIFSQIKEFELHVLNLLTDHAVPFSNKELEEDDYEEYLLTDNKKTDKLKRKAHNLAVKSKVSKVAEDDVDERIASIKNKLRQKKRPTTERAQKKREAKKLKRSKGVQKLLSTAKSVKNENAKQKTLKNGLIKAEELDEADSKKDINPQKLEPVYNEEAKIVYSKIDFGAKPGTKAKKSHQNPREILKKLKDTKNKINELKEQGETTKAAEMQSEIAWKKAFEKIEGKKVKDDTKLLLKAIKKRKVEKRKSKTKWSERKERVDHEQNKRQKKRQDNLEQRSKDKKNRKLKRASKKGRVIAGF